MKQYPLKTSEIISSQIQIVCHFCKALRTANLRLLEHGRVQGVEVKQILAYICSDCDKITATPQISAAKIYKALQDSSVLLQIANKE